VLTICGIQTRWPAGGAIDVRLQKVNSEYVRVGIYGRNIYYSLIHSQDHMYAVQFERSRWYVEDSGSRIRDLDEVLKPCQHHRHVTAGRRGEEAWS